MRKIRIPFSILILSLLMISLNSCLIVVPQEKNHGHHYGFYKNPHNPHNPNHQEIKKYPPQQKNETRNDAHRNNSNQNNSHKHK